MSERREQWVITTVEFVIWALIMCVFVAAVGCSLGQKVVGMANGISDTALATSAKLRADGVEHRIEFYIPLTGRLSWTPTDVELAIPGAYYHAVLTADGKSSD